MDKIQTFEEFVNDNEYDMLLEEINAGNFTKFDNLNDQQKIKIMERWDEKEWSKYRMRNTISERECFEPIIKIIRGESREQTKNS